MIFIENIKVMSSFKKRHHINNITIITLTLLLSTKVLGQINLKDSTVQVIGYWNNKEKQTYSITTEKYKVKGSDTTEREFVAYEVDITIKDSTAKSYTIEWFYKNCKIQTNNLFTKKLTSLISQDMSVIIKTDEMGAFVEVVNWQEVKRHINKCTDLLKKEFKDIPKIDEIINQVESMFSSKEAIESFAIKDIQQFYTFHGGKYKLREESNAKMKLLSIYGGQTVDADVTVTLEEINFIDKNSTIRMRQTVDSKQLTDAFYEYIKKLSTSLGTKPPKRDEIPPLQNETWTISKIHGPSGWVIYSVETKEVKTENIINFEKRIIERK